MKEAVVTTGMSGQGLSDTRAQWQKEKAKYGHYAHHSGLRGPIYASSLTLTHSGNGSHFHVAHHGALRR